MNNIDTTQLLTQLRAAAAAARAIPLESSDGTGAVNFQSLLTESISKVNELQQASEKTETAFIMGNPKVSLADTMIAENKAGLAFEAMVQTRNKLVDAYQQIMQMQV